MKRQRDRRESSGEGYAPDRTAALLWAAVTLGTWLIWAVATARNADRSDVREWLLFNWSYLGYYGLDAASGVLMCAGIHGGRRWGFVGKAFHSALVLAGFVYFRQANPTVLLEVLALSYCLLRLAGALGKRPPRESRSPAYAPDRFVAYAFLALNTLALAQVATRSVPSYSWALGYWLWFAVSFAHLGWLQLAVARSRGWTPIVGAVACGMGVLVLFYRPDDRLHWFACWGGLLYFAARLGWLGPRPEGLLGLRSD